MQTDIGLIIAIVGTGMGIIAVVVAMFFWVRSEANDDRRSMQDIQREDRKDLLQLTRNIENVIQAIQSEMKDFHNRLIDVQKKVG